MKKLNNLLVQIAVPVIVGAVICVEVPRRILKVLCAGWIDVAWEIRDVFEVCSHMAEDFMED
jgi:hypothetical protein